MIECITYSIVTVTSVKRQVRKFTFSEVAWDWEWFITVIWCFMLYYSVNKVVEIKSQHLDDKYCDIHWKRWKIIIGFLSTSSWPLQMTKRWKMRWERKRIFCSTLAYGLNSDWLNSTENTFDWSNSTFCWRWNKLFQVLWGVL